MHNGRIICGDVLSVLPTIDRKSVNLVITSPPYASIEKDNNKEYISYGIDGYVDWMLNVSKEISSVLTDDGSFVLNINTSYHKGFRSVYVYELVLRIVKETPLKLYEDCIWVKTNPMPSSYATAYLRPRKAFEYLFWFTLSSQPKVRLKRVLRKYSDSHLQRLKSVCSGQRVYHPSGHSIKPSAFVRSAKETEGSTPYDVLVIPTSSDQELIDCYKKVGISHPAVFPLELPEWFIIATTDEGDTVLDPFMGSGTTALAAINLNRRFIGIDISEKFCKLAVERIKCKDSMSKLDRWLK